MNSVQSEGETRFSDLANVGDIVISKTEGCAREPIALSREDLLQNWKDFLAQLEKVSLMKDVLIIEYLNAN